jgi:hypothetical protein
MAGRALDIQMPADQCVASLRAVIEFDFAPFGRNMTGFALLAKSTVVLIFLCMAIETERGRFAMFCTDLMAILTGSLLMRARQEKIGQLMIEQLRVEPDNICVTTYMLGMAGGALLYIGIFIEAVVSDFSLYVTGNIFMTRFAQRPLLVTFKSDMTTFAIGFDISVPLNDLPGHDECLKVDCAGNHSPATHG